jgi:hypothetical protein
MELDRDDPIAFEGEYTVVTHGTRHIQQKGTRLPEDSCNVPELYEATPELTRPN